MYALLSRPFAAAWRLATELSLPSMRGRAECALRGRPLVGNRQSIEPPARAAPAIAMSLHRLPPRLHGRARSFARGGDRASAEPAACAVMSERRPVIRRLGDVAESAGAHGGALNFVAARRMRDVRSRALASEPDGARSCGSTDARSAPGRTADATRRGGGSPHDRTTARPHDRTTARQHDNTTTRCHDNTMPRVNESARPASSPASARRPAARPPAGRPRAHAHPARGHGRRHRRDRACARLRASCARRRASRDRASP
ncbi:Uncharacterised protein [Burkholderia pseudomallei]|nr:Uncharacterised protein [Burkholderia pseudomallei]